MKDTESLDLSAVQALFSTLDSSSSKIQGRSESTICVIYVCNKLINFYDGEKFVTCNVFACDTFLKFDDKYSLLKEFLPIYYTSDKMETIETLNRLKCENLNRFLEETRCIDIGALGSRPRKIREYSSALEYLNVLREVDSSILSKDILTEKCKSVCEALFELFKATEAQETSVVGIKPSKDEYREGKCDICEVEYHPDDEFVRWIQCSTCEQRFHTACIGTPPFIPDTAIVPLSELRKGWQCGSCKVCSICKVEGDLDDLVFCDGCDKAYHMKCYNRGRKDNWVGDVEIVYCEECRRKKEQMKKVNDYSKGFSFRDIDEMKPILEFGQCLKIYSLGKIVTNRPAFHTPINIFPAGFCSVREARSPTRQGYLIRYKSEILDTGAKEPLFKLEPEGFEPLYGSSSSALWGKIQNQINEFTGKGTKVSGVRMYGLDALKVRMALEAMDGVSFLSKYKIPPIKIKGSKKESGKSGTVTTKTKGKPKAKNNEKRKRKEPGKPEKEEGNLVSSQDFVKEINEEEETRKREQKRPRLEIRDEEPLRRSRTRLKSEVNTLAGAIESTMTCVRATPLHNFYPYQDLEKSRKRPKRPNRGTYSSREKFLEVDIETNEILTDELRRFHEQFPNFVLPSEYDEAKISTSRVEMYQSPIHGCGVIAKERISPNEILVEYKGELVRASLSELREKHYKRIGKDCYIFRLNNRYIVDATMKGGLARMINHSCGPNCVARIVPSKDGSDHVVIVSGTVIEAGEEICYDYNFQREMDEERVPCRCSSKKCRGYMN